MKQPNAYLVKCEIVKSREATYQYMETTADLWLCYHS